MLFLLSFPQPSRDVSGAAIALFTASLHNPHIVTHTTTLQGVVFQLDAALQSPETQRNGLVFIYDMSGSKYSNFDYELSQKILTMLKVSESLKCPCPSESENALCNFVIELPQSTRGQSKARAREFPGKVDKKARNFPIARAMTFKRTRVCACESAGDSMRVETKVGKDFMGNAF